VAGCCECGEEPSDSIKCGELLDQLRNCQLLKKDSAPRSYAISSLGTVTPLEVPLQCLCDISELWKDRATVVQDGGRP